MRKLTAIIYTVLLTVETFLGPIFFQWYEKQLNCQEPCGEMAWPIMYSCLFVLAQMVLCGYLWARAFNSELK